MPNQIQKQGSALVEAQETRSTGISVRDVVFIIYRRKWVLLALALPIILIGGLSLFSQTGTFTAAARVLVELTNVDTPRWNVTGRNIDYDRELSTFYNIAMSVPVASLAAESLRDSIPVMLELAPMLAGLRRDNELRDFLLNHTDVNVVGESRILEFRFTATHPRIALMGVGAMRDAFVDYHVHGQKNTKAIAYYEEQIEVVRGEIDSLLAESAAVLRESGYSDLDDNLYHDSGQLASFREELVDVRSRRTALEIEHERLVRAMEEDPLSFPMGQDQSRSNSLVYARQLVTEAETKLNNLLATYTPESKPVQRQREILAKAREHLLREERAYVESVGIHLRAAREKEREVQRLVDELLVRRQAAPATLHKASLIQTEVGSLREVLEGLQTKLGEVRISQLADERISSIIALTDPELTQVFGGGKTMIYFAMIVFFALTLGVAASFLLETMDHRVKAPRDVEEKLQLPVFASVSRSD